MATFEDISNAMRMLLEEQGTPRNTREKLQGMLATIKAEGDNHLKADKLLMQLDDLQSDMNIPSYIRTGLMSISGMLEDMEE